MKNKAILILGVGNTLLRDEGFGVHAVYFLQQHYQWPANVSLVDGGTRGLMLMSELMEADLAVILDIVLLGHKPGTIYFLQKDNLDCSLSFGQSMHQTGLNDILASCELAGHRPETIVFGFEPFDYISLKASLTPEAEELLPIFCGKVVNVLKDMGVEVEIIG